jgi:hypothetical protein
MFLHSLLNVLVEIADKMGLQKNVPCRRKVGESVLFMYWLEVDLVCGLVVRVPGYRTEIYCASCEVRTEFICVM